MTLIIGIITLLIGVALGGVGAVGYFIYTGSTLNWKKRD